VRDGGAGLGQERLAGCGESDAFGQALKQRPAELALQRLDLLRQGGLGDEQLLGRARERAFVRDREEVAQLAEVHRAP
jgi:hypothetical protein